ncbi:MAG: substrate-binding domain-containing protein, partial [Candidatus Firestonebacteria bacterium]|nr:substrate-binding domain-containing protein [Candidatus Firestonebacteria bacterium]
MYKLYFFLKISLIVFLIHIPHKIYTETLSREKKHLHNEGKKQIRCVDGVCELVPEIYVFAASSLADAMNKICNKFEEDNNCKIQLNLDSSGRLYQEILRRAPSDIFISANYEYISILQKSNLLDEIRPIASNDLVVIAPIKSNISINKLTDIVNLKKISKIAMAEIN